MNFWMQLVYVYIAAFLIGVAMGALGLSLWLTGATVLALSACWLFAVRAIWPWKRSK